MVGSDDFETVAPRASKATASTGLSLKARAIGFLSRREHSRRELERKLKPHASDPQALVTLLDELAAQNWQSDERFAYSLVNRRAARQGWQRIASELHQHRIPDAVIEELKASLLDTEADRARDVWERKFGEPASDAKGYAKQYRFMASRGFSPALIRTLLGDLPT